MSKKRVWVLNIKKEYVCNLLKGAESNADANTKHLLRNGLETLFKLQSGDKFVTGLAIKNACANVINSPSAGLYAWLDVFNGKFGAGVVETRDKNLGPAAFRIRKEFYEAVKFVLESYPNCSQ